MGSLTILFYVQAGLVQENQRSDENASREGTTCTFAPHFPHGWNQTYIVCSIMRALAWLELACQPPPHQQFRLLGLHIAAGEIRNWQLVQDEALAKMGTALRWATGLIACITFTSGTRASSTTCISTSSMPLWFPLSPLHSTPSSISATRRRHLLQHGTRPSTTTRLPIIPPLAKCSLP